jgi:hypothetical protein
MLFFLKGHLAEVFGTGAREYVFFLGTLFFPLKGHLAEVFGTGARSALVGC